MDRFGHGGVGAGREGALEPFALHAEREDDHLDVLVLLSEALDQRQRRFGIVTLVDEDDLSSGLGDSGRGGLARVDIAQQLKCAAVAKSRTNRPYDQWVVGYDNKSLHDALPLIAPRPPSPAASAPSRNRRRTTLVPLVRHDCPGWASAGPAPGPS